MTESSTPSSLIRLPKVSRESLRAVVHDLATDPTYSQRVFNYHNNYNHKLMSGIVAAANKQAGGDIRLQEGFIEGAKYALAALQRQVDTNALETLWEEVQVIEFHPNEESPNVA